MFYAVTTRNGFEVTPHATYEAAADWLLASLNGDYADDFWIESGRLCSNYNSRVDFDLSIYDCHDELIRSVSSYDEPQQALRAIADALDIAEVV